MQSELNPYQKRIELGEGFSFCFVILLDPKNSKFNKQIKRHSSIDLIPLEVRCNAVKRATHNMHKYVQCLPKVLEHLLWFMLQTSYKIPSPLKQCCVKEIWITLYLEVMHFCITKGFRYRLNIVWRGEGVCTPIGDTKKGKESENL